GLNPAEIEQVLQQINLLPRISVEGLMTIPPLGKDPRPYFRQLRQLRDSLGLRELSMGMSNDYEIAIEEGATMVRIGSAIFGART
ncbi:MAG: alanine racemase, partial [Verrucomicrobiae bacterium]|nr:alanine racemase [Verrucomicrobiae bacterium]